MIFLSNLIVALELIQIASALPIIAFPLNSQLPPVARIDRDFSYTFSSYTFQSDSSITYTLGEHPSWLSLNGHELRLFGKPDDKSVPPGDVVGQSVEIIATDAAGSVSLNATLVVSRHKGPSVKIPIEQQMSKLGLHSAPSSLLTFPQTSFKYTFDPNTFDHEPNMINYYAVSANSSPLPSWVKFDPNTLTFSGITPPFETLIQPPQTFSFELVASDIVGFSAVALPFSIVVGTHKLTAKNPTITLDAMRGSKVSYDTLREEIKLDGMMVKPQDLKVSTSEVPPWLKFHFDTWKIEGTPQQDDHSTNFTIKFGDTFDDALEVVVDVKVATGLFQSTFEDLEIKAGEEVDLDLASYFRNPKDIEAKLSMEPSQDWLKLDGLVLSGKVPESAVGNVKVKIEVASKSNGLKETEGFEIRFLALNEPTSTSTSVESTSTTTLASPTHTKSKEPSDHDDSIEAGTRGFSTGKILLATILPVLAIVFIIMLLVCLLRRRRRDRQNYLSSKSRMNISKPIIGSLRINGSDTSVQHVEKAAGAGLAEKHTYMPPQRGYAEVASQISTASRGSDSSGNPRAFESPRGYMAAARDASRQGTEDRESWFTVEGSGTTPGSDATVHGPHTKRPYLESRQQLLPAPEFYIESPEGSVGGSIDLGIPMFDNNNHHHHQNAGPQTAVLAYNATGQVRTRESSDALSTTTSSSAALPGSGGDNNYKIAKSISISKAPRAPMATVQPPQSLQPSPLPNDSSDERMNELRALNRARVSSHQWLSRPEEDDTWYDIDPSSRSKSFGTDSASFRSGEHWRAGGRQPTRSPTYDELVKAAPFHPSRPSTVMLAGVLRDGTQPGERGSQEWMSPSRWGASDPGLKRRTEPAPASQSSANIDTQGFTSVMQMGGMEGGPLSSNRLSRLTETSSIEGAGDRKPWRTMDRDNMTPKVSEGSFKMFI